MGEPDLFGVRMGAVIGIGVSGEKTGGEDETKTESSFRFGDLTNKMGL